MNMVIAIGLAAAGFSATLILEWVVLRTKCRTELATQRARHKQQQQTTCQHLDQAKRQIGQLQHELAAAKLRAKRHTAVDAVSVQRRSQATEALQRALDEASASWGHAPPGGFADTLPSPRVPHDIDLLLR